MIQQFLASIVLGLISGGIPIPYSPQKDDGVTVVLLGCFFLSAYVLSRSRKFLVQLGKDFLLHRERNSIFDTSTAGDMRCLLFLILQTCVLAGVGIYACFVKVNPDLLTHFSSGTLLGIYVLSAFLYLFVKWLIYSFLGWTFFDKLRVGLWMESYSTLLYYWGFLLFPFILSIVYFNLSAQIALIMGIVLLFLAKILMLYKWLKLFCNNLYGCFRLILYFCALEIVPCLLLYKGMADVNEYLIIKF